MEESNITMKKIIFFLVILLLVVPFVSAGFVDWMNDFFGDSHVTGYVSAEGNICLVSDSIEEKLVIVEDNLDSLIHAVESAKVADAGEVLKNDAK